MSHIIEQAGTNKLRIKLSISAEQLEEGVKVAYNKTKGKFVLPGFRKGKAPRKIIEAQYGRGVFYDEALDHILPPLYSQLVEEEDLDTVSRPELDLESISHTEGAVVYFDVYVRPHAEVKDYKGLGYYKKEFTVTDEEVQARIDAARRQNARMVTVEDRPAALNDTVSIDFEGFIDGEPFEGGISEDYDLMLGSHNFIGTFEDQLVGVKPDDDLEVKVTFPDDYHVEDLSGKDATFKVHVNSIKYEELPEEDDDFAQDVSEYSTMDEYRASVREKLVEDKGNQAEQDKENQLLNALTVNTTVEIPEAMIYSQVDNMVRDLEQRARGMGLTLENYLGYMGVTYEQMRHDYRPVAEQFVKTRLALEGVAEAEGFAATEEEVDEEIANIAKTNNMDVERLKPLISKEERKSIGKDVAVNKALKLIAEHCVQLEGQPDDVTSETKSE